jgi:hypothetical protein
VSPYPFLTAEPDACIGLNPYKHGDLAIEAGLSRRAGNATFPITRGQHPPPDPIGRLQLPIGMPERPWDASIILGPNFFQDGTACIGPNMDQFNSFVTTHY